MKTLYTLTFLFAAFMASSFTVSAQNDATVEALKNGNAVELSKFFDDNVEVKLPTKSDMYSKAQAQLVIKDFFDANKVESFKLMHKGNAPSGYYFIGTLATKSGNFRATIFIKSKNKTEVINEIRFLPEG